MIKHPEDNDILELFNQGEAGKNKAFTLIVTAYGKSLYSQIRYVTRNHEDTNDILQNVFVKTYRHLNTFKGDSALYTWLFRIARNETLNFLDKEKRRFALTLDEPMLEFISGHSALDNITPEFISKSLLEAIDSLPEKQAIVFQLKYFEDLKFSEISARIGTSEGALKANYHYARQKIEQFLLSKLNH